MTYYRNSSNKALYIPSRVLPYSTLSRILRAGSLSISRFVPVWPSLHQSEHNAPADVVQIVDFELRIGFLLLVGFEFLQFGCRLPGDFFMIGDAKSIAIGDALALFLALSVFVMIRQVMSLDSQQVVFSEYSAIGVSTLYF